MNKAYNIFTELTDAIDSFNNDTVSLNVIEGKNKTKGYNYSQKRILENIDRMYNSVYESGLYDAQGQRKSFINIVKFYVKVAIKNTNPNISEYNFTPTDYSTENIWSVWFTKRQFNNFIAETGYGQTEDDLHVDFNKYGTCVAKKLKDEVIRVPLGTIMCDQTSDTLLNGVRGGVPLILKHDLSYVECKDFPNWDITKYNKKRKFYEMYSYMCKADYLKLKNQPCEDKDYDEMILTVSILSLELNKLKDEKLVFIEELKEEDFPFEECHSEKIDNRWLGVGNVENQFENQLATNKSFNLRLRKELWASKNIYYTMGDGLDKNLIKHVDDGEVMQVGVNGNITRIDTTTRSGNDSTQIESIVSDNAQKQSFAFEAATGESMGSGTPFRLGAMLSNSVMSYFDGQKEIFGRFREKIYFNQMLPIFKKTAKDDMIVIGQTEEGYGLLKEMFIDYHINDYYTNLALDKSYFDTDVMNKEQIREYIMQNLNKHESLFVDITKDIYKNAKLKIKLDLSKKTSVFDKESITTIYTQALARGDTKKADKLEAILMAQSGIVLSNITGGEQAMGGQNMPVANTNQDLAQLVPELK